VRVKLRIRRTRCPVPERRADETGRLLDRNAAVAAANSSGIPLEVADCLPNGEVVRRPHFGAHASVADGEEHAHTLRSRVRQIECRDTRRARDAAQRVMRVLSGEEPAQLDRLDGTAEPKLPPDRTNPLATRFVSADVVLLEPIPDALDDVDAPLRLVEVVPGLAGDQLADREHLDAQAADELASAIPFASASEGAGVCSILAVDFEGAGFALMLQCTAVWKAHDR
jgi:hypothetical protein